MQVTDMLRSMVRSWLHIDTAAAARVISIQMPFDYDVSVYRNQIWYRGQPAELDSFYQQVGDYVGNTQFWGASGTTGITFRKIHTGLPALIVDTLSDIVMTDFIGISVDQPDGQNRWDEIAEENNFIGILEDALSQVMVEGDGAFKLSYDPAVSDLPIIEYFPANRVEFVKKRGRMESIIFTTQYKDALSPTKFVYLKEVYKKDGVTYILVDENDKPLDTPVEHWPGFAALQPVVNPGNFMLAVPVVLGKSALWKDRGKSLFETKHGAFDSFDECYSTWMDAVRDGRINKYIPDKLVPQNPRNGTALRPNSFDNRYISTAADRSETAKSQIEVIAPDIRTDNLLASYTTSLDLCLQGLISPSTLGIDVKKLDNAEAQREKEKATLYTRDKLIGLFNEVVPVLVATCLKMQDMLNDSTPGEYEASIEFGEYSNPSFEAQVETVGKAVSEGIMSVERAVEELYGDRLTPVQKQREIMLLAAQHGFEYIPEGGGEADIGLEIPFGDADEGAQLTMEGA